MKLLLENWRKYLLNEVSFEQAKNDSLAGKVTEKMLKGWLYGLGGGGSTAGEMQDFFQKLKDGDETIVKAYNVLLKDLRSDLLGLVSHDIPEDSQKGQALLWVIRFAKKNPEFVALVMNPSDFSSLRALKKNLEIFFQQQRFMSETDLNKIHSPEQLESVVEEARPAIEAYQEKQAYMDVEEGMEIFRNDSKWLITGVHNKGAACELGKGTDWCTAARGLDYFEQYYAPDDPLFVFKNKKTGERYQFHYGTSQFMDEGDVPIDGEYIMKVLHGALMKTAAPQKYEVIRTYNDSLIARTSKDPEELEELAERYAKDSTQPGIDLRDELISNDAATKKVRQIIYDNNTSPRILQSLAITIKDPELLKTFTMGVLKSIPQDYEERQAMNRVDYDAASGVMYRLGGNPNITEDVIDELINSTHAGISPLMFALGHLLEKNLSKVTKKQFLKIAQIAAGDGKSRYYDNQLFMTILRIGRVREDKKLLQKILALGLSTTSAEIKAAVAKNAQTPIAILEKLVEEGEKRPVKAYGAGDIGLPITVQMALIKNPNTTEEILNKILDGTDSSTVRQTIALRGISGVSVTESGRYAPPPSEEMLRKLLLFHKESPMAAQVSTRIPAWTQQLVKAAATNLHQNYNYSIEDLAELLGEEYKEAVKQTNPGMGNNWANYLFDSHSDADIYEQTEPFQKAVKKNYRKMKMRLTSTGPNKYNVGGKMEKPPTARSKSAPVGFGGSLEEEQIEEKKKKKKKKPCKKAKGKKYVKRVDGKCRSYGQAGKAKDGGDRIKPGTKKGDAYCARSLKIKKCKNPPCANDLSRKKWKCRGAKSIAEEKNEKPS